MDPWMPLLLGIALGAVLGGLAGWFAGVRRGAALRSEDALLAELRSQLNRRDQELTEARNARQDFQAEVARAQAQHQAGERLLDEQQVRYDQQLAELKQSHQKALADLQQTFKALSADALRQTHPEFIRLANETLSRFHEGAKGELSQRQQAIAALLEPLKQQLEAYQKRLQQSETSQSQALGDVKQHLTALAQQSQTLSQETLQLRQVLSSNQARGRWGEETLRRVVESAGMSRHCDFSEQTRSGDAQPDLVVRLPGERVIIVDSKVPDLDVIQALDRADPQQRQLSLAAHATKLKTTIKDLADRDYPRQFPNALDYVVLFLPAESLFSAALEGDRDLIIWAADRQILLATPASLIALLRSVSVSWQQHAQTENARAIAKTSVELYSRVNKFTSHLDKIRSGLERASQAYNDAVGSFDRMVRPSGERLQKLKGAAEEHSLTELSPLEKPLRLPPTPE